MNSGKLFELFIISLELLLFLFIPYLPGEKNYSKHIAAVSIPRSIYVKHLYLQHHGGFFTRNHYVGSLHGYLFYSIVL